MSDFASMLSRLKRDASSAAAAPTSSDPVIGARRKRPRAAAASAARNDGASVGSSASSTSPLLPHPWSMPPVRKIYVVCPAFAETGGPEALHQLCHAVNILHHPVREEDGIGGSGGDAGNAPAPGSSGVTAAMLYLREHGGGGGGVSLEHVRTDRARSSKYDRYDAPAATCLPGEEDGSDAYCDGEHGGADHFRDGLEGEGTVDGKLRFKEEKGADEYSDELVIWPECWTHHIDALQPLPHPKNKRKRYQIAIWWLSVDNNKGRFSPAQFRRRNDVLHLAQSAYARDYVSGHLGPHPPVASEKAGRRTVTAAAHHDNKKDGGGDASPVEEGENQEGENPERRQRVIDVTEFITTHASEQDDSSSPSPLPRDLGVVYNPIKGMHFTDEIVRRANSNQRKGGITFTPIGKGPGGRERMTGEEVAALLRRAKVYIDFGPHPGMDRLPREAALAGCIIVTNRRGAAGNETDVPIPSRFKFGEQISTTTFSRGTPFFDADGVVSLLRECCSEDRCDKVSKEFDSYREWIRGQEGTMKVCVSKLVDVIATDRFRRCSGNGGKDGSSEKIQHSQS